jgi:hypothetical protein
LLEVTKRGSRQERDRQRDRQGQAERQQEGRQRQGAGRARKSGKWRQKGEWGQPVGDRGDRKIEHRGREGGREGDREGDFDEMTEKSKDNPQRSDSEVYTIASVFVAGNFAAANHMICAWKNVTHGKKLRYGLILPRWPSMDFLLIDAPRFASFYPEPLFTGHNHP